MTAARIIVLATFIAGTAAAQSQPSPNKAPSLEGVYESIPNGVVLSGGLKNSGSPDEVPLTPSAAAQMKTVDPKEDAGRLCLPVGPVRMAARDQVRVEFAPAGKLFFIFYEDVSHGHMRIVHLDRPHPAKVDPTWLGDSSGHWEGETLVIDTVGFNDRTWLNDKGAPHSDALHLTERIRPLKGGAELEYKVTVEDTAALTKPYSFTRFYQRSGSEIHEDICEVPEP